MPAPSGAESDRLLALAIDQHRAGQLVEAERAYRQILARDPGNADSLHLLGIIAHQRGEHANAVDLISRAIARKSFAPFHYNLGLALAALGKGADAAAQFEKAIGLNPSYADAHSSLGDAHRDRGRLERALACYERAAALKPSAENENKVGAALLTLGRFADAIVRCERAAAINPALVEAQTNLAKAHLGAGRLIEATTWAARALERRETFEAKTLFVQCVRNTRASGETGRLRGLIQRGLIEPWGRPDELIPVAMSMLMRDDALRAAVQRAAAAWPQRLPADDALSASLLPAFGDPLLHALLEVAANVDLGFEQFLTSVRRAMLERALGAAPDEPVDERMLRFLSALARQCFVNEYVFFSTPEEEHGTEKLRELIEPALTAGAAVPPLRLIAVASYLPIGRLAMADGLLARAWPDGVDQIVTQQVREPREEQALRATMPRLTDIADDVSLKVREMYEQNPYPRWIKTGPTESPKRLDEFLRNRFPMLVHDVARNPTLDILLAGCGTGRQAVEMAQRFAGAKVLAIDLSLASLGYAKRKTQELGLTNLEFAQADILKLGQLGRSFDLIESSGVLHHLEDPWAGWRVLLSLLRPGGYMRIGLYSELGRPGVIAGRALVAERGYPADPEGIRQFREAVITGNFGPPLGDLITKARDFFTTSELRDLVFHVREHRMTIPQIADFLRENELRFLGFELDPEIVRNYRARFPDNPTMTNLEYWHAFETAHPDTFYYTYQFWVQAPQAAV
jgi:tetratricopeptide (TPR) repeat protein/SAM-dependent methyltransferase